MTTRQGVGRELGASDYNAIAALVYRYAAHVRRANGGACGELFTQCAIYEIREVFVEQADGVPRRRQLLEGRQEIAAYIAKSTGGAVRACPLIHNLLIEVQGLRVAANSILESRNWPTAHGFMGEYEDAFQQENGRWLFASRIFTLYRSGQGDK